MESRAARVSAVQAAGFAVGPEPDSMCTTCGDIWGDHLLHPLTPENPFGGGTFSCPVLLCPCFGTWAVGLPDWGTRECDGCGAMTTFGIDPLPGVCLACVLKISEENE